MVWDLPTRIFHWSFAISIIASYITGERGNMFWHELFGLAALGLLVFRLIWGVVGAPSARLTRLFHPPAAYWAYLKAIARRHTAPYEGHNPLGALAVLVFFIIMGSMAITGLWTDDDVLYLAPLSILLPEFFPRAGYWHIQIHFAVIPLIALHVLAVAFHRLWLGEKLASRMITGGISNTPIAKRRTWVGLALLIVCVGGATSLSLITPNY